jgi:hypothetical protein
VQLDGDVRPYLAALMIAALHKAGETLVIPDKMAIKRLTEEEFDNLLKVEAGRTYDNYGTIAQDLIDATTPEKPVSNAERDRIQREKLTEVLGEIVKVLETFNDDDGSDTGMAAPVVTDEAATRITAAVVNVAKKIEENVRRVVTAAAASPAGTVATPGAAIIK